MNTQLYNIICLSNQQWDYPLPTNKKHVMSRLAERGHKVLFVDPPINTGRMFVRQVLGGKWGIGRLSTQTYRGGTALIYSPLKPIPSAGVTAGWHISKIQKLAGKFFDPSRKTILWIYHVEIQELKKFLDNLSYDILVYDCVDDYTAFPGNSRFYSTKVLREKIVEQEKMLTERADFVFASAPGLVEKLKHYRQDVHFTPNVGNYEKFKVVQDLKKKDSMAEELRAIKGPRVGFTGAVDGYKFDSALVKRLAKDYPNYSFVIIGPFALKDKEASPEELGFSDLKNVHFLGSRPYDDMEYYFAGFDAFMIPYQLNAYTVGGCFPVKFHEALAAGLPTIVTDLPAYYPFRDVCYIAKDHSQFSEFIGKAVKEDSADKISARVEVASRNSWEGKVDQLLEILAKHP